MLLRPKLKQKIKGPSLKTNVPEQWESTVHWTALTSVWVCHYFIEKKSHCLGQKLMTLMTPPPPTSSRVWLKQCGCLPTVHTLFLWVWLANTLQSQECRPHHQAAGYHRTHLHAPRERHASQRRPTSKAQDGLLTELKWYRCGVVSEKQWHKRISRCGQILLSEKVRHKYVIWALDRHGKNVGLPQIMKHLEADPSVNLDNKWVSSHPRLPWDLMQSLQLYWFL